MIAASSSSLRATGFSSCWRRSRPSWRRCTCSGRFRLDALPDLSDTQVIVYSRWDRIARHHRGPGHLPDHQRAARSPGVKAVRGYSDFGFLVRLRDLRRRDHIYWARLPGDRVPVENPGAAPGRREDGTRPRCDRRGWVFQYALVDRTGTHRPDQLRSYQDWTIRYALQAVPGVAEWRRLAVRSPVPGDGRSGKTLVLTAFRLIRWWRRSVRAQRSRSRYGVRRQRVHGPREGYSRSVADFEQVVVKVAPGGTPVLLRDVARVEIGPNPPGRLRPRRAGRHGRRHRRHAARRERAERDQPGQARLDELTASLPEGVEIVTRTIAPA